MDKLNIWFYVAVTVLVAVSANSIAKVWADQPDKYSSPWFFALILFSPLVFITFGLTVSRMGMAIGSGTVDALLTVTTVMVGLIFFREWGILSWYQLAGLGTTVFGIILMQLD